MGGTSEREFLENINIKTKASKRVADVKNDFAKMQKNKGRVSK